MSKFTIKFPIGATPIAPDELKDLIPDYISTMTELNQLEQANIADAFVWINKQKPKEILTASFILELHRQMFGQVWRWAGKMRLSNKNIGIMKEQIMNELGKLIQDTTYWTENKTFPLDEIAVRFHHRLVQIHVFPNGNGRHARLITDLFLEYSGKQKFTWGISGNPTALETEGNIRTEYIAALKTADQGEFDPLIQFVRS